MLLSLLHKEEKYYFIDLVTQVVSVDGQTNETEKQILQKFKYEMGEDVLHHRKSNLSIEKLIEYFSQKSKTARNIVFMNVLSASLNDDWYSIEEHLLIEQIKEAFQITDKKKNELMKLVYADRDLREKTKRVVSE